MIRQMQVESVEIKLSLQNAHTELTAEASEGDASLTPDLFCFVIVTDVCYFVCLCALQLTERLSSLAEETHSGQMKKLKEICDK